MYANTVFNVLKTVSTIIFPLILFPYVSRVLGPEKLGEINFASSIANYISLLSSLGITAYAVRECSKVKDNKDEFETISSQLYSLNWISTVLAYSILLIVLLLKKKLYDSRLLILIACLPIFFQTLGADWVNTAVGDLRYISLRTILFQVINLVLIVVFVRKKDNYVLYAVLIALSPIGANLLNVRHRRKYCDIKLTLDMNIRMHFRPILLLFALTMSQTIYVNIDTTMIGMYRSLNEVGIYSVAVKVYHLASSLISAISIVVLPQLTYLHHNKNWKELGETQEFALSYITTLGMPMIMGILVCAEEIISILSGPNYMQATTTLRILSAALVAVMFGGAFLGNIVFLSNEKEGAFTRASIIAMLIDVVLNTLLIPNYGINAAAISTVISELFVFLYLLWYASHEVYIMNIRDCIAKPIIGTICFPGISMICHIFIANQVKCACVTIFICVICYIIIEILVGNKLLINIVTKMLKGKEK